MKQVSLIAKAVLLLTIVTVSVGGPTTGGAPAAGASGAGRGADEPVVTPGSGFVVTGEGLVATSWHVVEGARDIRVMFPQTMMSYGAKVAYRDAESDLAVLKLKGFDPVTSGCRSLPYELGDTGSVVEGDEVSTIGYPLQPVKGMKPAQRSAVVSAKNGFAGDPRCLQIETETQHGTSGSPAFDAEGNVIGVLVSTPDAAHLYSGHDSLPQGVSFVIKSERLDSILPETTDPGEDAEEIEFDRDAAILCLVSIRAKE